MKKIISLISVLFVLGCTFNNPFTVEIPTDKLSLAAANIALIIEDNKEESLIILDELSNVLGSRKISTDDAFDHIEKTLKEKGIDVNHNQLYKIKKFMSINIKAIGINVDPQYEEGWENLNKLVNLIVKNLREE